MARRVKWLWCYEMGGMEEARRGSAAEDHGRLEGFLDHPMSVQSTGEEECIARMEDHVSTIVEGNLDGA